MVIGEVFQRADDVDCNVASMKFAIPALAFGDVVEGLGWADGELDIPPGVPVEDKRDLAVAWFCSEDLCRELFELLTELGCFAEAASFVCSVG